MIPDRLAAGGDAGVAVGGVVVAAAVVLSGLPEVLRVILGQPG
jgi:hypothetical protein